MATTAKPTKRQQNPLGNFSSSTYQLTLYMISPDAYNAFIESGRKSIKVQNVDGATGAEAVIVAQSGGVNNTTNTRADGFKLDHYIDDLKITSMTSGKATGTASNLTKINFTVYEPYGFSFITNLKKAADTLRKSSKLPGYVSSENASRQFFILSIKFQGYDDTGKPVTGDTTWAADTFNSTPAGGAFERFFEIMIVSMKHKIDGRMSTYNITAASVRPQVGFGTKYGRISLGAEIVAGTVAEAIGGAHPAVARNPGVKGLLDILNENEKKLLTSRVENREVPGPVEYANEYRIKWLSDAEDRIGKSEIISPNDMIKSKMPMSTASMVDNSNDATSQQCTAANFNMRKLTFKNDTSVMQAISTIITQSAFLEKALSVISEVEVEANAADSDKKLNPDNNPIMWYNLSTELQIIAWDKKRNDFAYIITYVIQPYETPAAVSEYIKVGDRYYGPHKKYNYWYTGLNSEILRYEQVLDNGYFNITLANTGDSDSPWSMVPQKQENGSPQGKQNDTLGTQNNYVTNLYDPSSYTTAKIQILGDPDYLMSDTPGAEKGLYNRFYGGDGYTINPNGGDVFIEIDFKEGKDYAKPDGTVTGLMDINSSILFWDYPDEIKKKVNGVSYQLLSVVSTFSKGMFTQDLTTAINTFAGYKSSTDTAEEEIVETALPVAGKLSPVGSNVVEE